MYTKQDIKKQLTALGVRADGITLVHTSLRSVGALEAGGVTLLDALVEYFTEGGGLLCIPTHTWDNLGKDVPTLDLTRAESNLGVFTELAAADARGVRSENPTHSMAVFGDRARALEFIKDDAYVTTPTSPESCYGKLWREGGSVLLIGVSHNKNTFLHSVDEMLGTPNRMADEYMTVSVKRTDGTLVERKLRLYLTDYTEDISWRFHKYETAFRYHGCIRDGFIGDAPAQLCSARGMKEVVELITSRSGGTDPLSDEEPISPKLYIKK